MNSPCLHYGPIALVGIPLAIAAGESLKDLSHPGHNMVQQGGSILAGLGWGAAALGLGGVAFLVRPSQVKKVTSIFGGGDTLKKSGETGSKSLWKQGEELVRRRSSLCSKDGSPEENIVEAETASVQHPSEHEGTVP
jgi:hypothetical protein